MQPPKPPTAHSSDNRDSESLLDSSLLSSSSFVMNMERDLARSESTKRQHALTWSASSYHPNPEPPPSRGAPSAVEIYDVNVRRVVPDMFHSERLSGRQVWKQKGARLMKEWGGWVAGVLDLVGLGALSLGVGSCIADSCCLCPQPNSEADSFVTNEVISAKYGLITFLPLNLFEQFQRVANLYFLLVVILMNIPGLAVVSSVTTIIPLVFVLLINAVKEAHDDIKRHRNDALVNNQRVEQLVEHLTEPSRIITWREVQVGHLIKVQMNQSIPADMILLQSGDPDNLCYLETANLDGETNLKLKYCYHGTSTLGQEELMRQLKELYIECEHPNPSLYTFEGSVVYKAGRTRDPLTADNLLLRGCTLRNADWVVGLVVFTGPDTKIMLNAVPAPGKVSQLERSMNHMVICMFVFQMLLAALCGLGTVSWARLHPADQQWYIRGGDTDWDDSTTGSFFLSSIRFALLLNQLIPISLYVTLELVKFSQCTLLYNNDQKMYHEESDTPFVARTTTLNEELGQVKYVLSDKTGTLTQNVMGFVMASAGGQLYGGNTPAKPPVPQFNDFAPHTLAWDLDLRSRLCGSSLTSSQPLASSSELTSRQERERLLSLQELEALMMGLVLCNTVVPTKDVASNWLYYQATSPDEEALVQCAAYLGYVLLARNKTEVEVQVKASYSMRCGRENRFQVLAILEFDSDRKRMSIITRETSPTPASPSASLPSPGASRIRLYCKGADSVIATRLLDDPAVQGANGSELQRQTQAHLDVMAQQGLRTLSFAHRDLSEEEFQHWYARYQQATVAVNGREEKIAALSNEIECDLLLDGATGVEDKLQDRVPEAIEELGRAGIKVWVLTGDKVETAISIAHTCRLFKRDMHIVKIREPDLACSSPEQFLKSQSQKVSAMVRDGKRVGVVIDGAALQIALTPRCESHFLALCLQVHSVVCCRVSPMQKADITCLVRNKAGAITLGIGDGANDVSMIKAAHVGCGISGREGRAAVLAADYAFAQFHFLVRLLVVHGRAAYKRNSLTVLYSFYKNFMYCLPFVFGATVSGFSCLPVYPAVMLTTFNAIWTAAPIVAYAVFEQDVDTEYAMAHPELYRETMEETKLQFAARLLGWLVLGAWHGTVAFILPLMVMTGGDMVDARGVHFDWSDLGTTVFTSVIIIANLKVAIKTSYWTRFNIAAMALTLACWLPFVMLLAGQFPKYTSDFFSEVAGIWRLLQGPQFWLVIVLTPIVALLPDLVIAAAKQEGRKDDVEVQSWKRYSILEHQRLRDAMYGPRSKEGTSTTSNLTLPTTPATSGALTAMRSLSLSLPVSGVSLHNTTGELYPIDEKEASSLLQGSQQKRSSAAPAAWEFPAAVLSCAVRFKARGIRVDPKIFRESGAKQQLPQRSGSAVMARELMPLNESEEFRKRRLETN